MNATLKFIGHIITPYEAIEDCPNNIDLNGPICQLVLDEEFLLDIKPAIMFENRSENT